MGRTATTPTPTMSAPAGLLKITASRLDTVDPRELEKYFLQETKRNTKEAADLLARHTLSLPLVAPIVAAPAMDNTVLQQLLAHLVQQGKSTTKPS